MGNGLYLFSLDLYRAFFSPGHCNAGRHVSDRIFYSNDGHIFDDIQDDRACSNNRVTDHGKRFIPARLDGFGRHAVFRGNRHIFRRICERSHHGLFRL